MAMLAGCGPAEPARTDRPAEPMAIPTGRLAQWLRPLAEDPEDAETWLALAQAASFEWQDADTAERCVRRVLSSPRASATTQSLAWRVRGDIHVHAQRHDQARAMYAQALVLAETAAVHRSLVHLEGHRGNLAAAASHAQRAWALDPQDPIAGLLLAALLRRNGAIADSESVYARSCALAEVDADLRPRSGEGDAHCCIVFNGAGYWAVAGRLDRALDLLDRFVAIPAHRHITQGDLRSDPDFTALHGMPRFERLLAGLPP